LKRLGEYVAQKTLFLKTVTDFTAQVLIDDSLLANFKWELRSANFFGERYRPERFLVNQHFSISALLEMLLTQSRQIDQRI
jgi:hypothetical protein